jgi:exonuclease VII small subunit
MMPEMREMKKACDEFLKNAEKVLGKLKEQQEAEDEQD